MIIWSDTALRQLFSICDYMAKDSEEAAGRCERRIYESVSRLNEFPRLGRSGSGDSRELVIDAYVVSYRVKRNSVRILKVRHGAQIR